MLTALKPLTFPLLIFSSSEVEANSVVLVKGNGLISGNVGEMEMVGNWDENHGRRWRWLKQGQGRGYGEDGKTFQQKGWGGLDDFATICLQLSCSVLCGRTGGWWPPYFCWLQPFLSPPFLFLYLLPALFIPHWPHAAQLAGVAVCSQPQPSPSPPLPSYTSILPDGERSVVGHSHLRVANNGPFQFYVCYLGLELSGEGRACPLI